MYIFRITHNPTTNSMHITGAENKFEYSLRMVMDGYEYGFSCKMLTCCLDIVFLLHVRAQNDLTYTE